MPRAPRTPWLFRLLLLGVILIPFVQILGNDFVTWDDERLIYQNPNLNPPTPAGLVRGWDYRDPLANNMYDPLVYTAWWVIAHVAQLSEPDALGATLNPMWFHAANLLTHWITACIVLEILIQLGFLPWPALFGAALFAVHPLQSESIAWATAMKDLLSGLLVMLALLQYLIARESQGKPLQKHFRLATLFYFLALLAKPSAIVAPLLVLALDILYFRRPWKGTALLMLPWFLLAALATALASHLQVAGLVDYGPLWARPLIALDALAFYLYKLAIPIRLSFDYGRNPTALLSDPAFHHSLYWSWIFPAAIAILAWRGKSPAVRCAAAVFALGLLPVLGLAGFHYEVFTVVADRYVYVSMLGAAIFFAWLFSKPLSSPVWIAAIAILVALMSLSFAQAQVWHDTGTLFGHGLELNDRLNYRHYLTLGDYKDTMRSFEFQRLQEARAAQDAAAASDAQNAIERDLDVAIACYQNALHLNPAVDAAYDRLAGDLVLAGRIDKAISVAQTRIEIQPDVPAEERVRPDMLRFQLGRLYEQAGRYPQAAEQYQMALRLNPESDAVKIIQDARAKLPATRP